MTGFRNIIFDLGGVILNLDYGRTSEAFRALGLRSFDTIYSQVKQSGIFDEYEKGRIGSGRFRQSLAGWLPEGISDAQIDAAWNAMLLDLPGARLKKLEELGREHRLFLLSNTNEIHITEFRNILRREHGLDDLSRYFEKTYFSYEIGMRKPDTEIFLHVLGENGLDPAETLFLDDSPQHVEGAGRTGIIARLVKGRDILDASLYLR